MAMNNDAKLKSIWDAIFLRRGGESAITKLWKNWDEGNRSFLLNNIELKHNEIPVLLSKLKDRYVILTTQQLITELATVNIQNIIDVLPIEFAIKNKNELNEMDVYTNKKETLRISVDSGKAYFGLWNILLQIVRSNRSKSKKLQ